MVHSGMTRARSTAGLANLACGLPVYVCRELAEQDLGVWEGRPWPWVLAHLEAGRTPPGGEGREAFAKRVWRGLRRVRALCREDGTFAWIGHGGSFFALGWPWGRVSTTVESAAPFRMHFSPGRAAFPWQAVRLGPNGQDLGTEDLWGANA